MNNFVIALMVIWGSAAIGTIFTKKVDCFEVAGVVTIAMGIGYYFFIGGH